MKERGRLFGKGERSKQIESGCGKHLAGLDNNKTVDTVNHEIHNIKKGNDRLNT